ncbi:MAG: hypothetical protein LBF57_03385 [Holosporaceae bacterium]|jgi:phage gpG-like protein|nr:hypothetical protein [Holosporaceae bacterium]
MEGEGLIEKMLNDIRVEMTEEFDKNFERKSFFNREWERKERKNPGSKGSPMMISGNLRRSIRSYVSGGSVVFRSSLPYASILNEGGRIKVTPKMKRFFWAKYYEKMGKIKRNKDGKVIRSTEVVKAEASFWKTMALKKTGSMIIITARRFIGSSVELEEHVKKIIDKNMEEFTEYLSRILKPKK